MTTLAIDIRKAKIQDALAISNVHNASWRHSYCGLIPHKALGKMIERRNVGWWRNALESSTKIAIANIDEHIVGYATFGANRTQGLLQKGEIYEIYLLPEYQGVGIGGRLFRYVQKKLGESGETSFVVWCLEDNHIGCRFYRAQGGVGLVKGHECFDGKFIPKLGFLWN